MVQYEPHKIKCDSATSSRLNYREDQKRERGMEEYFQVYQ